MKRFVRPVITLVITIFVTAFLFTLFSFSAGGTLASAARPKPTPTPNPTPSPTPVSSGGVNFQTNGNLNPGDTFCGPVQQVAGIQGGFVEGGGSSYKYPGAPPIATRFTITRRKAPGFSHGDESRAADRRKKHSAVVLA